MSESNDIFKHKWSDDDISEVVDCKNIFECDKDDPNCKPGLLFYSRLINKEDCFYLDKGDSKAIANHFNLFDDYVHKDNIEEIVVPPKIGGKMNILKHLLYNILNIENKDNIIRELRESCESQMAVIEIRNRRDNDRFDEIKELKRKIRILESAEKLKQTDSGKTASFYATNQQILVNGVIQSIVPNSLVFSGDKIEFSVDTTCDKMALITHFESGIVSSSQKYDAGISPYDNTFRPHIFKESFKDMRLIFGQKGVNTFILTLKQSMQLLRGN